MTSIDPNSTHTIAKASVMMGTGILSNLVIFNDIGYLYLAIVGAFVSMFGVLYDIYGTNKEKLPTGKIVVETIKGFVLGIVVIPFWYLSITEGVFQSILHIDTGQVSNSLALLTAFGLSWNTIPMYNWAIGKIIGTEKGKIEDIRKQNYEKYENPIDGLPGSMEYDEEVE